jgi:YbbR domain-containing protein
MSACRDRAIRSSTSGPSDIKAYIDLSSVQEGEVEVPVHIEIPSGTELKKQSMTSTKITVDVYTGQRI